MRRPKPPPPQATGGIGRAGPQGARRVILKPREPGVSTFAQRPAVRSGRSINEAGVLGILWEAIHHRRTLYGRPCTDLRSFFEACDTEGHEAIVNDRLSDAMLRLDVGLTPQQVDTLISTIDVDVNGTVDYEELENWMKGRDEEAAAKFRAGRSVVGDLTARPPWGSKAESVRKDRSTSDQAKTNPSRLPAVSSSRETQSPNDEERHEYLRRNMGALIPKAQPTLHIEPKASQLEAAIIMHERGFQERRLVYTEKRAAARAKADKKARAQRRHLQEKNQQRLVDFERQRKEEIAAKFGLKMEEIEPEEWAEVEAEIEAQVERREKRKRRKEQMRADPTGMRRKRDRTKAKRVAAALQIQRWMRGMHVRRVVIMELLSEKAERDRKEALRQKKRLEVCDAVVEKLITDLERLDCMEQIELVNQLRTLQHQKVQLDEQYHAALDPTETAAAKAKAKRLAEEGKFAQRWAKLQKKREDEQRAKEEALAREIERAKTFLPAIFGTAGDEDASPPVPPSPAVKWVALSRGQQAAASRLGFNAQCWPELEENAVAAVQELNRDLPWDQWHPSTWKHIDKNLLLTTVAGILGLTERNWNKLKRCKPIPKRVYRIGTPPPAAVPEEQEPPNENEAKRLHKLAVYFAAKHEASLKADLVGQTTASREHFYEHLCTSLRPYICAGMPESLACMLRDDLMQLGWAGGETSEPLVSEPEPEPADESTEREQALAKELEEMRALAKAAMSAQQPQQAPGPEPELQSQIELEDDTKGPDDADNDSKSGVELVQLRAEETLKQLHAISGSKDNLATPTKAFGLLAGNHVSNFLRKCVQTVHSLRSDCDTVSKLASVAVAQQDKRSAAQVIASLIHAALTRGDAKDATDGSGTLTQVSHRLIDAFRFFDRNGDGKISPKELGLALRSLGRIDQNLGADFSMKEIEQIMKEADTDGDGSIDYKEFVAHFQYHEAECARLAAENEEVQRHRAQAAAQKAADSLAAAQQVRLEEVARETQAQLDAAEAERVLKYEARRVLPAVFNRPFEELSLAQEPAARRLGFVPEKWPRLSSAAHTVVPWEQLDQTSKRLAIVLGFDEKQDPATWVLIEIEGENGEGDVRQLGIVTGVRHAQQEFLQDEERKRRQAEIMAFRKGVFAEAARVGAERLACSVEAQEAQQHHVVLQEIAQEEGAAVLIQQKWKDKKAKEDDTVDKLDDDAFTLTEDDQQHVDAIWKWSLGDSTSEFLSRQGLERYLMETTGRQLTDSLYETMCEKIGFDPDVGMAKSLFVMAFYGPYMEPGQSASAQIAAHYDKLDLTGVSTLTCGSTAVTVSEPAAGISVDREREAELRQVFACVDINGDGALSRAELILRLRKDPDLAALLGLPVRVGAGDRAAFEAVFHSMDLDNDKGIDADEFVQFFARRESSEQSDEHKVDAVIQNTTEQSQRDDQHDNIDGSSAEPSTARSIQHNISDDSIVHTNAPDKSPVMKSLPVRDASDSESDSEEELSIEDLRRQRQAQIGGTPPRRGGVGHD